MKDDPSLHDEQLEDEIEGRMADDAIDEVLGLHRPASPGEAVPTPGGAG